MLSQFVDKIIGLGDIRTVLHEGNTYSNASLSRLKTPEQTHPTPLTFHSLTGLLHFLDDGLMQKDLPLPSEMLLHIVDPFAIHLLGRLQPENDNQRFCYATAKASPMAFKFGEYINLDEMVLALQCEFKQSDERDALIQMLGSVASEHVREHKDDGFSQSIQIKTGLRLKSEVKITNPIELIPYRTFRECEQVKSPFIVRFKARGEYPPMVMLKDAGGEHWQLDAMIKIRFWLEASNLTLPTILS
jgi:hypothetical protein